VPGVGAEVISELASLAGRIEVTPEAIVLTARPSPGLRSNLGSTFRLMTDPGALARLARAGASLALAWES
jgi:hypothetical protein